MYEIRHFQNITTWPFYHIEKMSITENNNFWFASENELSFNGKRDIKNSFLLLCSLPLSPSFSLTAYTNWGCFSLTCPRHLELLCGIHIKKSESTRIIHGIHGKNAIELLTRQKQLIKNKGFLKRLYSIFRIYHIHPLLLILKEI